MAIRSDYTAGTVTVSAGGTVVTGVGTGWLAAEFQEGDVFIADGWYCVIASVDSNTQITLYEDGGMRGGALAGAEYRLRYMSNGSRVSAQARELIDMLGASGNLQALGGLNGSSGDVPYFTGPGTLGVLTKADITQGVQFDAMVDTLPDRDAYDGQPVGFTVLVADTGDGRAAIYVREGGAGNWSAPAYITGPSLTLAVDQVDPLPYGDDPTVTLNSIAGGYELNFGIPQGMEIVPGTVTTLMPGASATVDFVPVTGGYQLNFGLPKGDTGTLTGLTPFYQTQVTTSADAAAARTGLGATTLGSSLFTAANSAAALTTLGVGTVGTINLPAVPIGDILYDNGTWGAPPEGGGYDPNIALLALELSDLRGGRLGMIGGVADPFDDETGVATKVNATYSAANDWYSPTTISTQVTLNGPSSIVAAQGYTFIDRTASVANNLSLYSIGVYSTAARSVTVKVAKENSSTNFDIVVSEQFSHGGDGWQDFVLSAPFTIPASGLFRIGAYTPTGGTNTNVTASVSRAYLQANATGTSVTFTADTQTVFPLRYAHSPVIADMTLTSVVYPAMTEPSIGRLTVQTSETVAIIPNDDLIGEISRDGGTTWSEANLTLASSLSGIKLYEDSNIDLSAQPSGDDMVWRVRTENNVDVAVSGVVAQWKE